MLGKDIANHWLYAAYILDLATILYCGDHTFSTFTIGLPCSEERSPFCGKIELSPDAVCSPERFCGCMENFWNGHEVWILRINFSTDAPGRIVVGPSYLRTNIETLSDAWGPAWSVSPYSEDDACLRITQYNIGKGSVIPWEVTEAHQIDLRGARLCHWLPYRLMQDSAVTDAATKFIDLDLSRSRRLRESRSY